MCRIAAGESPWLMVDPWEACQDYKRTALVLDHFDHEINDVLGGVRTEDGEQRRVRMMLLAGSDLISTMSEPGVWSEEDVRLLRPPYCLTSLLIQLSFDAYALFSLITSSESTDASPSNAQERI